MTEILKVHRIGLVALLTLLVLSGGCNKYANEKLNRDFVVSVIRSTFDALDLSVNEGQGYKYYINPDGFPTGALIAWSESYLMQAYAEMFRATRDEYYLDKLHEHIESVMHNRDDIRGQADYNGELVPGWGTNRYTKDGAWMVFAVHTGMITYPMLEFVQLVRQYQIQRLEDKAATILARVRESVDWHDRQWVLQEGGFGLYTYPEDYYRNPNYILPLNQQAAIARSLILLWELTGEKKYFEKAKDIALAIKGSLKESEFGGYVWGVQIGPLSDTNPIEDISHGTITIDFIRLAYERGVVFTIEDMKKLATTIKHLLADGRAEQYIDGTGDYRYEAAAAQYALLTPYDSQIWKLCYDLLFDLYRINVTGRYFQEDWWGTIMLGMARLAHYVARAEDGQ